MPWTTDLHDPQWSDAAEVCAHGLMMDIEIGARPYRVFHALICHIRRSHTR